MSFTEMMESAKGPGVIGTLMALIVLVGFGLLFIFSFNEGLQGKPYSMEVVIKNQRNEIDNIKDSITRGEKRLEASVDLKYTEEKLKRIKSISANYETRLGILLKEKNAADASIIKELGEFEKYKNDYRGFVRSKAKGQTLEQLETRSGTVYKKVTIRDVNPVGMQIMYDGGYKRIMFEDLPLELQDYYQFDTKQKNQALAEENLQLRDHESAVAVVKEVQNQKLAERKEREEQARRDEMIQGISIRQSRIQLLDNEIKALEVALPLESKKRISRAPEMRMQLSNKRRQLETLTMEIARLKSELAR